MADWTIDSRSITPTPNWEKERRITVTKKAHTASSGDPGATATDSPDGSGFIVSELIAPAAGASAPFGDDLDYPLPLDAVRYTHPGRRERPHLAGD